MTDVISIGVNCGCWFDCQKLIDYLKRLNYIKWYRYVSVCYQRAENVYPLKCHCIVLFEFNGNNYFYDPTCGVSRFMFNTKNIVFLSKEWCKRFDLIFCGVYDENDVFYSNDFKEMDAMQLLLEI